MSNKKILYTLLPILSILCCLVFAACTSKPAEYQETQLLFGTVITLQAYGENAKPAITAAFKKGNEIEKLMSVKLADSELSSVNNNAYKKPYPVSDETFFVTQKALKYAALSGGCFEPAIGHLVDLWGIGTDAARVPALEELKPYVNKNLYKKVVLDDTKKTIQFTDPECKLDFGGIAKGYAADVMKRILEEDYKVSYAVLNLGGNVLTIGTKPNGKPWNVGIKDPYNAAGDNIVGKVTLSGKSVVTSGIYERFFEKNGKLYHHIIDPHTGYPSDNGVVSVTIINNESADGDALSTSVFVMGKDKGMELINRLPDTEAIIITKDKKVYTSDGIDSTHFTLVNKEDYSYEKR